MRPPTPNRKCGVMPCFFFFLLFRRTFVHLISGQTGTNANSQPLALILTDMKYWKPIIISLAVIPFGFIISLLTFYFRAGLLLGHLPISNSDDPQNFPFYTTYRPIISVTGNLWFFAFIAWTFVVTLYFFLNRKDASKRLILYSAIGHMLAIILFLSKISEWYAD